MRFQVGPVGAGVFGWALLAVAALPLFVGREWRFAWAGALLDRRPPRLRPGLGRRPGLDPLRLQDPDLLLAAAAAALAGAVAMGAAGPGRPPRLPVQLAPGRAAGRRHRPRSRPSSRFSSPPPAGPGTSPPTRWPVRWRGCPARPSRARSGCCGSATPRPSRSTGGRSTARPAWPTPRSATAPPTSPTCGPVRRPTPARRSAGRAGGQRRRHGPARPPAGAFRGPVHRGPQAAPLRRATPEPLGVPPRLTRALGSQLDLRVLPSDPALDVYENVAWGGTRTLLDRGCRGSARFGERLRRRPGRQRSRSWPGTARSGSAATSPHRVLSCSPNRHRAGGS